MWRKNNLIKLYNSFLKSSCPNINHSVHKQQHLQYQLAAVTAADVHRFMTVQRVSLERGREAGLKKSFALIWSIFSLS